MKLHHVLPMHVNITVKVHINILEHNQNGLLLKLTLKLRVLINNREDVTSSGDLRINASMFFNTYTTLDFIRNYT